MGQGDGVQPVDLGLVLRFKRHHHAIAHAGRIAVERLRRGDTGRAAGRAPGDEIVELHHSAHAHLGGNRIIESGSNTQIIGAHGYIADHVHAPFVAEHSERNKNKSESASRFRPQGCVPQANKLWRALRMNRTAWLKGCHGRF